MILIDFSQTVLSNVFGYIKDDLINPSSPLRKEISDEGEGNDIGIMRHMILNSLRSFSVQFRKEFGEIVLCCDSKHSWRKDYFPFYKANRLKSRDSSYLNFPLVYKNLEELKIEFKSNIPYKIIEVEGAEGDDVIATLSEINEPTLIVSSDKDFLQLQRLPHIKQWNKRTEKYMLTENWLHTLQDHIIRGDSSDGIPNILSADNCLIAGIRQKPIMTAKADVWKTQSFEQFCFDENMKIRYDRNRVLIDLRQIPIEIKTKIRTQFDEYVVPLKGNLFNYMLNTGMKELIQSVGDF